MRVAQHIFLVLVPSCAVAFHALPVVPRRHHASSARRMMGTSTMSLKKNGGGLPMLPPARDDGHGRSSDVNKGASQTEGASRAVIGDITTNRKITLAFTCNLCEDRSAYEISRVAYEEGIVVVWCKGCSQKHLIADNLGKMDFPWFGRNIEEYMAKKGTPVKRLIMNKDGFGTVEARVPGVHFSADEGPGDQGYVANTILPGDHVGDSIVPGLPPMNFNLGGEAHGFVGGSDGDEQASSQESE